MSVIPPTQDESNRALAYCHILQLRGSERGRACLAALAVFFDHPATYGLDADNQGAVIQLVLLSLLTPSIREEINYGAPEPLPADTPPVSVLDDAKSC